MRGTERHQTCLVERWELFVRKQFVLFEEERLEVDVRQKFSVRLLITLFDDITLEKNSYVHFVAVESCMVPALCKQMWEELSCSRR